MRRCKYCRAQAVVWFIYRSRLVTRRNVVVCDWAACAEHEGCPSWNETLSHHMARNPDLKIQRSAP